MIKALFSTATLFTLALTPTLLVSNVLPPSVGVLYQSTDWISDGTFTSGIEGPAVNSKGQLYAVNFASTNASDGTIGKISGKDDASLFTRLPTGSIGNGIRFDDADNMYIADYVGHNIWQIKAGQTTAQIYAHHRAMNQPNDLAIMDNGILFASDPNWSNSNGQLWRIDRQRQITLLEKNMGTTNGIEVSPDNTKLYVNESVQRKIWVYDLDKNGDISNKKLLIAFDDHGLDGMRSDKEGNLMIARYGKGVIAMVSPQGKLLREIKLKGLFPTNVAFGGKSGKTVFVTMQKRGAIERFSAAVGGRRF